MTVLIIQGLWKESSKNFFIIVRVLVTTMLWKEGNKKFFYYESACDQNVNKSHHLLYLWQQDKKKSNLPLL